MQNKQRALTDKALFEYYLVSSAREESICSRFPYYIDSAVYHKMVMSAEVLDPLVRRIIGEIVCNGNHSFFQYGQFPLQQHIISHTMPLLPFFWVRYDAFQRENGGIFFSEFNYDKPCAQRETLMSATGVPDDWPSKEFAAKFQNGIKQLWEDHKTHEGLPTVVLLVDPAHYEEVHLGFLYRDLLKPIGYDVVSAGGSNLVIENDKVMVFGKQVDILLRQYPTEFLQEIPCAVEILRLFNEGKVLLLNDPRAIFGQTKSLFAYLWQLVEESRDYLSEKERQVIKDTIPYTKIYEEMDIGELQVHKDRYVVKAAYGRYSEEVYIGNMYSMEEWQEVLAYVEQSERLHIVQEFCPIRRERVKRFNGTAYQDENAFGNFGIYLVNGEYAGVSVRWSTDYLSHDETVWTSGIGIRKRKLHIFSPTDIDYRKAWRNINEKAAFEFGFTGGYTGSKKSFALQSILLEQETFEELRYATEAMGSILERTVAFVQENYPLFCPVLGIEDSLAELVSKKEAQSLAFIGRFDWVMDAQGALKLLEFNAETPAGLMEGLILADLIRQELHLPYKNPNDAFDDRIMASFNHIVDRYAVHRSIQNIGFVSTAYYEDWYNTTILYEKLKHLPYNLILGEVSGLQEKGGKLYLYGTPLDAVYRYYPLDWFDADPQYSGVIQAMEQGTPSINPPSTLISQSKAFWALVWDLLKNGFYTITEAETIRRYVPETALSPKRMEGRDFCIKPGFGREGQQVAFSFEQPDKQQKYSDCVFQEWIDIQPIQMDVYSTMGKKHETLYPVIGTYVTGNQFAGIYARAGGRITDKWAIYVPTYIADGG